MKNFLRGLVAIYAATGLVASIVILGTWGYLMAVFAGAGDGSGGDAFSETLKAWGVGIAVWIFPALAFIFMLLGSFISLTMAMPRWFSLCLCVSAVSFCPGGLRR